MWEIISNKIKIYLITVPLLVIFSVCFSIFEQSFLKSISYTISITTTLSWLFGKYLWKYVYFSFFHRNICPNFNGKWIGHIGSNYSGGTSVEIPIEIKADFFSISMKAKTNFGRSYSNYCRVIRTEDNYFEIEYIFKGYNDTPSETDTSYYDGAARVRVTNLDTMEMNGVYWTNRCWQQGKNTAGIITFKKVV